MIDAKLSCIALFAPLQKNLQMHARGAARAGCPVQVCASRLPLQIAGRTQAPEILQRRIWSGRSAKKAMSRPVADRVLQTRQTFVHQKSHVTSWTTPRAIRGSADEGEFAVLRRRVYYELGQSMAVR